jgi:leukotriene-A4 hydrolase
MMGYGYWNSYSSLHPNIRDDLPDNSFSEIPYEKGFQLLWYIQTLIGEAKMNPMLDSYIAANKYTSIKW